MNGLLRRLTRRRAAPADEHPPSTTAASEPADATVISLEEGEPLSEEQRALQAREEELRRQRRDLPAGVDPERLDAPATEGARRSSLRRRVRYLRRVREVLLRDLGGFYYEVHRAGTSHGGHRDILETKAGRVDAIDHELRALEERLGAERPSETVLHEPGIGGNCPTCGELYASDAGWCSHCGTPLSERARKRAEQEVDREIAARRRREAEAEAARGQPQPPPQPDAMTQDLAARVREATARDESAETAGDDAPTDEPAATGGDDAPTNELRRDKPADNGGEPSGHPAEDTLTQGERRR